MDDLYRELIGACPDGLPLHRPLSPLEESLDDLDRELVGCCVDAPLGRRVLSRLPEVIMTDCRNVLRRLLRTELAGEALSFDQLVFLLQLRGGFEAIEAAHTVRGAIKDGEIEERGDGYFVSALEREAVA